CLAGQSLRLWRSFTMRDSRYRYFGLFAAICLLAGAVLAQPAAAQQGPGRITRGELQNLDNFLDRHPAINQDLKKDPTLINNTTYIDAHPELREFLASHTGVRNEAAQNHRV